MYVYMNKTLIGQFTVSILFVLNRVENPYEKDAEEKHMLNIRGLWL